MAIYYGYLLEYGYWLEYEYGYFYGINTAILLLEYLYWNMAILLEYGYLSKHFYGDILEYVRIWSAVWNIWIIFPFSWEFHHPNWLSYFSEGLKPPTSDILEYVRIYPKVNIHMWKTPMVSIRGHDLPTMPHVSLQEVLHIYGSVITRDLTVIDGWYRKVG